VSFELSFLYLSYRYDHQEDKYAVQNTRLTLIGSELDDEIRLESSE
jgi:hypothetical protein